MAKLTVIEQPSPPPPREFVLRMNEAECRTLYDCLMRNWWEASRGTDAEKQIDALRIPIAEALHGEALRG